MNDEELIWDSYKNIVNETFNDYYHYKKIEGVIPDTLPPKRRSNIEYHFITKDQINYLVDFDISGNIFNSLPNSSKITIAFYMKSGKDKNILNTGITNTGDAFKILSTIITIIKEFLSLINLNKGDLIIFFAEESSRQKLYDRLTKTLYQTISNQFEFYSDFDSSNEKYYKFVRR